MRPDRQPHLNHLAPIQVIHWHHPLVQEAVEQQDEAGLQDHADLATESPGCDPPIITL